MELHAIAARALFALVFLWVLLRLSGKETVSHLSGRTLVVTLVLSDLPGEMFFGDVPAAEFIVAAGAIALVHGIVSLIAATSERGYALVEGRPPVVLARGRPVTRGRRRERISERELAELLRTRGVDQRRWGEIEEARVEREGQISVLRLPWARPVQRQDVSAAASAGSTSAPNFFPRARR